MHTFQLQSRRGTRVLADIVSAHRSCGVWLRGFWFPNSRMGASGRGCIGGAILSAGVWSCVGVFMVNVLNAVVNGAEWHDMTPLYVGVMVVAVAGRLRSMR